MRPSRASKKAEIAHDPSSPAKIAGGDKFQAQSNQRSMSRTASRGTVNTGSESPTYSPRMRSSSLQSLRRKRPARVDADSDDDEGNVQDSPATCTSANHNKYCHFCQHVKVRASSMLACENQECCRRFCEHCLLTHLKEDVDPMSSDAWSLVGGKPVWHCPICRTKCCCSATQCEENHRHCKAYRYRRRRAELATKRMAAAASHATGEKRGKKAGPKISTPKSSANSTPTMARLSMSLNVGRGGSDGAAESGGIDSPPIQPSTAEKPLPSLMSRPRREAALKRRNYAHFDDDDDEDNTEASTPASEESHQPAHAHAEQAPPAVAQKTAVGGYDAWDRGEGDEDAEHLMLGGIYGHMSQLSGEHNEMDTTEGMCHEDVISFEDVNMGNAELDEARWLRRTYETVHNPSARLRALQTLAGDSVKVSKPEEERAREGSGAWAFHPKNMRSVMSACESELSAYFQPAQSSKVWDSIASGGKCTVLYDFV